MKKLWIGVAISAVFLYLALRGIEWGELWRVLAGTRFAYLALAILLTMAGHYFRALRWKFLLAPIRKLPVSVLFSATIIGFFANNLLPARLGELVRAYYLGSQAGVSRSATFATIVYERVLDVFALLAALLIVLLTSDGPEWLQRGGITLLIINVALLVLLGVAERHRQAAARVTAQLLRPLPERWRDKMARAINAFIGGLATINQPRTMFPIIMTSIVVWSMAVAGFYFALLALDMHLPYTASLTLLVIVSLSGMIPSAPAYLGTTQYACVVALAIYGINSTDAVAYSLLYHASQFFPIMALGFYYMWRSRLHLSELSHQKD